MFEKILIANRGEIAVRIIRTCREMGIATVALYQETDRSSLHVWMADETVMLESPIGFFDQNEVLSIAVKMGVDAIHPGYGFLAEREDFARRCAEEGITFIGPPVEVLARVRHKLELMKQAREAGIQVPEYSVEGFDVADIDLMQVEAERLGYPLLVKSSRGGRGRGSRLVWSPDRLERTVRRAQAESRLFYGERRVYLERAILPAHQVGVQIIGDGDGDLIQLGEREGSLLYGNQKMIEESPAPCLDESRRRKLWDTALELGRLFEYQNVGTVEFLVNGDGGFYFTEIKPRIQIEHPLTEMRARVDLVRAQILISAGERLGFGQDEVVLNGWAIQSRINASNPWTGMPSPGHVLQVRLPGGSDVRTDTYLYCGCIVPADYDPLIAKLITSAADRATCVSRMQNALREFQLTGTQTNLPMVQRMLEHPGFLEGVYSTESFIGVSNETQGDERQKRDLAVIAAVLQAFKRQTPRADMPERLLSGWHRGSRRL
jgi:acetyl/propionyl-CoA carboxylase alpha subunit